MTQALRSLARSSVVLGLARGVDLLGAFNRPMPYEGNTNPALADFDAIASDWQAVGQDLEAASDTLIQEEFEKE